MQGTPSSALRWILPALVATTGCADEADVASQTEDFTEIRDLYRDYDQLDVGDLLSVGAGFATDGLNDALGSTPYANIQLTPTELYAGSEVAGSDFTIEDLDQLTSGLVDRFGHRELTTEVNLQRQAHLAATSDVAFAESAFVIDVGHDWRFEADGFEDGSAWLGFSADGQLEARVITAVGAEWEGYTQSPLEAMKVARGFVMPRHVGDFRAMKPGESFALHGSGELAFNAGVGVPFLVAGLEAISYNLVLSAALRVRSGGALDVQAVRLADDSLVVDVGIEAASLRQAKVALQDGWGVQGLVESQVSLGPIDVDLGRLVEKALRKQLDAKLDLIDASLEKTQRRSRLSVARMRFDLARLEDGSAGAEALAQALRGDLRLAQALANGAPAEAPGVVESVFELSRSGVSATSYAGIDLLGMRFFREVEESSGEVVVQTPGGARTVFFDGLHQSEGWFFSSHGYTRVGLAGMVFDAADAAATRGEANLLVQVVEGDDKMERDKLLDHLDAVVLSVAGPDALAAVAGPGDELERFVEAACPHSEAFDPCREEVLGDPTVVSLRASGIEALAGAIVHLEPSLQELILAAGELRLTAQATYEPKALLSGPPTSIVVDHRLDDAALATIFGETDPQLFALTLQRLLGATEVDRHLAGAERAARMADVQDHTSDVVADATALFGRLAERYQGLLRTEELRLPTHPELGRMGDSAVELRFGVDSANVPLYEQATARSVARARSAVATDLYDLLVRSLDEKGIEAHSEQLAAYALMALAPSSRLDVRVDVDLDLEDSWEQSYDHYRAAGYASLDVYGQGANVQPIDGGLFDVDTLIDVR